MSENILAYPDLAGKVAVVTGGSRVKRQAKTAAA